MRNRHGDTPAHGGGERPRGAARGAPLRSWSLPDGGEDLELLLVAAGPVELGRDDGEASERPRHLQVIERPFWIARAPVTRGAWRAFARATRRPEPGRSWWPWTPDDGAPITAISWDDAQAFCAWAGLALPTEAEWERAALLRQQEPPPAVTLAPFPFAGAAFPHVASTPLLAPPPSPPGLLFVDGLGEWCEERYSERAYLAYALGNVRPPERGEQRLARTPRDGPRARWARDPHDRTPAVGLRPVLRATGPPDGRGA